VAMTAWTRGKALRPTDSLNGVGDWLPETNRFWRGEGNGSGAGADQDCLVMLREPAGVGKTFPR